MINKKTAYGHDLNILVIVEMITLILPISGVLVLAEVDRIIPYMQLLQIYHYSGYGTADVPACGGIGLFHTFGSFGANEISFGMIKSCTL